MQLHTSDSIKFFDSKMKGKYPFKEYESLDKPTLFFGAYSRGDIKRIVSHRGPKLVLLNGSDSCNIDNIRILRSSGANLIYGSQWGKIDLIDAGPDCITGATFIPFFFGNIYDWKPEPLGDSLYWYGGNQTKYGKRYQREIRTAFPDLDIIIMDNKTTPHEQMPEIYKKCFAGVRLVEHDGMSQTVSELALMGRMSIWNGGGPFSIGYRDTADIIRAIKELREKKTSPRVIAGRTRSFFIQGEKTWCRLVMALFGAEEAGVAGIFNDAKGRCGSIFRIQRREDIAKIGGLGDSQYERPWFCEQIKKLGKKQFITSKHSGFVATEFKGVGNKGYPGGVEYNTYDKKYD